jgi:small-conductance mechanosensitive channel
VWAQTPEPEAPAPSVNLGLGQAPEDVDRSTPRRSWAGFLDALGARDYNLAAHHLDLREVLPEAQQRIGPDLARKLHQVLRKLGVPQASSLPDTPDPAPTPDREPGLWLVKAIEHAASKTRGELLLRREAPAEGSEPIWLVAPQSVASMSAWHSRIVEGASPAETPAAINEGLGPAPEGLDRGTPYRSLLSFIDSCRVGDFDRAAHSLWLNAVRPEHQAEAGRRLARRLKFVLDQELWIDFDRVSDSPYGRPEAEVPDDEDEIGTIELPRRSVPIRLLRVPAGDNEGVWLLSPKTVDSIDALYEHYGIGPVLDWIPGALFRPRFLELELWRWLALLAGMLLALIAASLLQWLVLVVLRAIPRRLEAPWGVRLAGYARGPVRALLFLLLLRWFFSLLGPPKPAAALLEEVFRPLLVFTFSWLLARLVAGLALVAEKTLGSETDDASLRRAMSTRLVVLRRLINFIIAVCAVAIMLMQFELVRNVGAGLLASAGLAGLVLGFAAQQTLSNVFTGIQLAVTQPVRIDDTVIFEGEFGTVEEISLTHVVIRTWDLRRIVVPIPYLLGNPIQNWTRQSPDLLGTVFVQADYTVDVTEARHEAIRAAKASRWWDRKVEPEMLVTDLKDRTVELRVMVSAADAGQLWKLRCEVREAMLRWLQKSGAMPRMRLAGEPSGEAAAAARAGTQAPS